MSEIIIAGAGYGGLTAAINLARNGYDITVIEKQQECNPGHDWHDCLNIEAFEKSGIPKPDKKMFNTAKKQGYYNPSATAKIELPLKSSSILMDRKMLTSYLIECAKEVGVHFVFDEEVISPVVNRKNAVTGLKTLKNNKTYTYEAELVIDSAGMYSPVRSNLPASCGIQNKFDEENIFHIFRGYYKNTTGETTQPPYLINLFHLNRPGIDWVSTEKEYIDVLVGKFGAAGSLSEEDIHNALSDYRKTYPFIGDDIIRGGIFADIPLTKMLPLLVCDGYAAVGDCAGMTEPLNGCGISLSMQAGKILADTIINSNGRYTKNSLWQYQYEYFNKFGKNLLIMNKMKNFCVFIEGKNVDSLFESDIVHSVVNELINGKKIKITVKEALKAVSSLRSYSNLLLPFVKNFSNIPMLLLIANTMPKNYENKKVEKWIKLYSKI